MLKVTPDTNVLVSAAIAQGNEFSLLKKAHEREIELIISPDILIEFRGVILRKKFGFSEKQVEDAVKQLVIICRIVFPQQRVSVIKADPTDNRILECALAGKADYIVSGDRHLLELRKFKGIHIVRSFEILDILLKEKKITFLN
ncbi:MAG: putative toxin-antitoxin system toxin component, PIN family [Nanoarchaeota archaeon]